MNYAKIYSKLNELEVDDDIYNLIKSLKVLEKLENLNVNDIEELVKLIDGKSINDIKNCFTEKIAIGELKEVNADGIKSVTICKDCEYPVRIVDLNGVSQLDCKYCPNCGKKIRYV